MSDLIKLSINEITNHIRPILEGNPEIVGAYLFGSSLEYCRPDSDIDIAIIPKESINTEKDRDILCSKISNSLAPFNGNHQFDVIVLNENETIFSFQAIKKGQEIYIGDHAKLTDFIEKVSRRYGEDYPRYKNALNIIVGGA